MAVSYIKVEWFKFNLYQKYLIYAKHPIFQNFAIEPSYSEVANFRRTLPLEQNGEYLWLFCP